MVLPLWANSNWGSQLHLMKHNYHIQGMTCQGCRKHVEDTLATAAGVTAAEVDLEKALATITTERHITKEQFQEALPDDWGRYSIHPPGQQRTVLQENSKPSAGKGTGMFYCPIHCEAEKTYEQPGDCPVCGMDLIEEQSFSAGKTQQWACPMHPEVVKDQPGSCPLCGMDLVAVHVEISAEEKTFIKLRRQFWVAILFTVPIFLIAMSEMLKENPLYKIMDQKHWNWIQFGLSLAVVFYSCWMFFDRAYRSIITWKLNLFSVLVSDTLILYRSRWDTNMSGALRCSGELQFAFFNRQCFKVYKN